MTWLRTSARARRRTSPADRGEAGFTLVELMVTMAIMSIVATSVMSVAFRLFATTSTVTNRRDVLTDGRQAIDQMTKQLRQGVAVDQANSSQSQLTFSTYINGDPVTVVWRVTGSKAPYTLEQSRDGGATFAPLVSPLLCKTTSDKTTSGANCVAPFTQTLHGGVADQVTIDLTFQTNTSSIDLISDVQLRNATDEDT
jgi:prepilin-type N-terminal cleavage/methylation domain-containing protein